MRLWGKTAIEVFVFELAAEMAGSDAAARTAFETIEKKYRGIAKERAGIRRTAIAYGVVALALTGCRHMEARSHRASRPAREAAKSAAPAPVPGEL